MTDIIQLLESVAGGNDAHVCALAKTEIERLRGEHQEYVATAMALQNAVAEIERLRAGVRCPHCDELRLELGEARRDAARLEGLCHRLRAGPPTFAGAEGADEIERLRQQVTKRGARMQVIRAYLQDYSGAGTTLWRDFCRVRPDAAEWFDEEGVPR